MNTYVRSPELMDIADTVLVVVDIQERLVPHIGNGKEVERNAARLIDGAAIAEIPRLSTVQYPQGLGGMVDSLGAKLDPSVDKLTFSCAGAAAFREELASLERRKVLLCGIETHVCVQQTAFDLLAEGYLVYLAIDAIGSRREIDHGTAIRRMEAHGVSVCTTEASLFEWCQTAGTELFKQIRKLVV